ncbi:hypothetical protein FKM82_005766 [Ascaphus truei]
MYFVSFLMFSPPPVSPLTLFQVCLLLDCPAGLFSVLFGVWVRGGIPRGSLLTSSSVQQQTPASLALLPGELTSKFLLCLGGGEEEGRGGECAVCPSVVSLLVFVCLCCRP